MMKFLAWIVDLRSSEVDDLKVLCLLVIEKVLELEVAMDDLHRVAVGYGCEHLFENLRCICLRVRRALCDLLEKLSAVAELCHYEVPLSVLVDLEDADDVRMVL